MRYFLSLSVIMPAVVAIAACSAPEPPAPVSNLPDRTWGDPSCAVSEEERLEKHELRLASLEDEEAAITYTDLVQTHAEALIDCRAETWPETQGIWLRLYPYDAQPGVLEDVFDRIVNRGYNQVYVEVFYEGRVMLPVSDNPTVWRSILEEAVAAGEVDADYDLWQEAINVGRERGVEVHGWNFSLNYGWGYQDVPGREEVLVRNGLGETSIANAVWDPEEVAEGRDFYEDPTELEHLFVDPYNEVARDDYLVMMEEVLEREPDGMLFDYIRYPTTYGQDTIITEPQQLWIYSEASRQQLAESLASDRERFLMDEYLDSGELTAEVILDSIQQFPDSLLPFESGEIDEESLSEVEALEDYRAYFWDIATTHAYTGVVEFAELIAEPAIAQGIPAATVFFPAGNRSEEGGFDARMQPWDRFPSNLERHPMSYAICEDGSCVADQVARVVTNSATSEVCPILAGAWGRPFGGHASWEQQMRQLQAQVPDLDCVSHFVYAWMEPDSDRDRKAGIGTGAATP